MHGAWGCRRCRSGGSGSTATLSALGREAWLVSYLFLKPPDAVHILLGVVGSHCEGMVKDGGWVE